MNKKLVRRNDIIYLTQVALLFVFVFASSPIRAAEEPHENENVKVIPYRSPSVAGMLPLFSTAAMIGTGFLLGSELGPWLIVGGASVAPSLGLIYTGEYYQSALTSLGRLVCFFGMVNIIGCDGDRCSVGAIGVLSSITWAGLTLWDIISAPVAALRFNQSVQSLALVPMIIPSSPRSRIESSGVGLSFVGRF